MSVPTRVPVPTAAHTPTPTGETSCERPNPDSRAATVAAFHAVTLYTIADAFDLCWQEASAVGYRLDNILAPLLDLTPHQVPWSVRREMLDGTYTYLLGKRQQTAVRSGQKFDATVLHASIEEWTEILLLPVFHSYDLNPVAESRMHFEILNLLQELGVGDQKNPRPAMYLPTDLRLRILSRQT